MRSSPRGTRSPGRKAEHEVDRSESAESGPQSKYPTIVARSNVWGSLGRSTSAYGRAGEFLFHLFARVGFRKPREGDAPPRALQTREADEIAAPSAPSHRYRNARTPASPPSA